MDRIIYTAMGAASSTLDYQTVSANNLANASTPGFQAQLAALRAVPINGAGQPTRTFAIASTPGIDMTQGPLNYTGRPLDVALQQNSFLAVAQPDGGEAYTRNGAIQVSPEGVLTVQGRPLMGDGGPIEVPPQAEITIAADGTVSVLNAGGPGNAMAPIGRLKLVRGTEAEMVRADDGLFYPSGETQQQRGNILENDPQVRVMPGVLEGSNVSLTKSMIEMIDNARRFEMQMKTIRSVDDNEQRANALLAMS